MCRNGNIVSPFKANQFKRTIKRTIYPLKTLRLSSKLRLQDVDQLAPTVTQVGTLHVIRSSRIALLLVYVPHTQHGFQTIVARADGLPFVGLNKPLVNLGHVLPVVVEVVRFHVRLFFFFFATVFKLGKEKIKQVCLQKRFVCL